MALAFDEFGSPFIITKEQEQKTILRGLDAQKPNISFEKDIPPTLSTSLGFRGIVNMLYSKKKRSIVKTLQNPDSDIAIRNDGATILEQMDVDNQIANSMVELA